MRLVVQVKPNSKHASGPVEQSDGTWLVYITEQPVEGKANLAVQLALAKHFDTPKTAVRLIRGATSKQKVFDIDV